MIRFIFYRRPLLQDREKWLFDLMHRNQHSRNLETARVSLPKGSWGTSKAEGWKPGHGPDCLGDLLKHTARPTSIIALKEMLYLSNIILSFLASMLCSYQSCKMPNVRMWPKSVLYVCISIPTLQIGSSVPFF